MLEKSSRQERAWVVTSECANACMPKRILHGVPYGRSLTVTDLKENKASMVTEGQISKIPVCFVPRPEERK